MYSSFDDLNLIKKSKNRTLIVAAAHDEHTIDAVLTAADNLGIAYILTGDGKKNRINIKQFGKICKKRLDYRYSG